jgi:hypothetical protein
MKIPNLTQLNSKKFILVMTYSMLNLLKSNSTGTSAGLIKAVAREGDEDATVS